MIQYNDQRLLHGGDYNPEQWLDYPEVLAKDLELMKKANVNTVTVGIFSWSSLEPREGEYHFEWLDKVFEEMNKMGGRVILATPSGGRPQWLSEKYPQVNRTNALGQKHRHGFRHNHCYTSPIYRQKVQEINRLLAERYGQNPALLMWHISNEYSGECYCELCCEEWRQWLKQRYGSLEAINKAWWMTFWSNNYSSWSQVMPPSPLGEHKVHGMDLDWKRFVTDRTIDFYLNEIQPIRELTPDIPVTTNFMAEGHDQHDFIPLEGIDYAKFAKVVDIVSWDSYPDWNNNYESIAQTAMKSAYVHDQYRSLKKQPFLVMESTPSVVNWHQYNKSKRPGVHILSSMQQIAHGSDSTLYFQWRQSLGNSEKFHGAVVGHDNSEDNRVYQEVVKYGERLSKLSPVKGSQTQAKVAILFDWESNWALKRGGGFGRPSRRYPQTLQEHYQVFWEQDIPVDILTPQDDFSEYQLVIAPMLYLMTETTMEKLQDYVAKGGVLVSSYFTGVVNETDLLHLGPWPEKLQQTFGITTKELDMLFPEEHQDLLYQEKKYQAKDYCGVIEALTAETLATYDSNFYAGTPALTKQPFGKGIAFYLAARTDVDFLREFYQPIIETQDLANPLIAVGNPCISVQTRVKDQKQYHFMMNFSEKRQRVTLQQTVRDLECDEELSGTTDLAPYEVRVFFTEKN
ncbi:beta-galactosidase [Enterococcus asini]|uniref:beta-galactosidase n=1 Tax=Enterococcus asini TaxID=57732 RepID=UPI00288FC0BC|nr:beta-galactosidase [Enterococcus asini]MDT2757215.1 beta-galactosidase [Enterococcus asini]